MAGFFLDRPHIIFKKEIKKKSEQKCTKGLLYTINFILNCVSSFSIVSHSLSLYTDTSIKISIDWNKLPNSVSDD